MESDSSFWPILLNIGLRLLVSFGVILVGRWLARRSRQWLRPILERASLSESLVTLFTTLIFYAIWVGTGVVVLTVLGFPVSTILAAISVVLIILGIALQQSLRDIAATVNFLLFKPFEPGDLIETNTVRGTVREIQMFSTTLLQWDNKVVILPNGEIQQKVLTNYSKMPYLRTDLAFTISYGDDIARAKQILLELVNADPRILPEPPPEIVVLELDDNGVKLGVRASVAVTEYWNVMFDLRERAKIRFEEEGITIPFPQRTVHMAAQMDRPAPQP
jgi:small conductance mechanosensitive channel